MLPPIAFTPEQAAAIAVALAAQPEGPYAAAGREALDAVVAALEPDPRCRETLLDRTRRVREESGRVGSVRGAAEEGVARHRVLVLAYRDGDGAAASWLPVRRRSPGCSRWSASAKPLPASHCRTTIGEMPLADPPR